MQALNKKTGKEKEDELLHKIFLYRYGNVKVCPECGRKTKFHRVKSVKTYICQYCRYSISPLANTFLHKSYTPLSKWINAIHIMKKTDGAVSSKELQRTLKVTYKTAWRIKKQINNLAADGKDPLYGFFF